MSERQTAQPGVPYRNRPYFDLVMGTFVLLTWPILWRNAAGLRIGVVVGFLTPALWLLGRALRRCLRPELVPKPWSPESPTASYVRYGVWTLSAIYFFSIILWLFPLFDTKTHPLLHHACMLIAVTAQLWIIVTNRYTEDRSIPPPDEPLVPLSPRDVTPLRSNHWGQPKSPNPGAAQP